MRLLLALILVLLLPSLALAQSHSANTIVFVDTNTQLKQMSGTVSGVRRNGFTSPGDGGDARYVWSSANCTAPDDGAQVQPVFPGCWLADFSETAPTPKVWGAKGDGTTNDTAKVQAAINAIAAGASSGRRLRIVDSFYCVNALTIPSAMTLEGAGPTVAVTDSTSGLKTCASNVDLLTITGNGVRLANLVLNGRGGNTAGTAIKLMGHEARIENNHVNGFCNYIYNIGRHNVINSNVLTDNVNPTNSTGCVVVVDGDASAQTIGSTYINNILTTWGPSAAQTYFAGMIFQNSGGPYIVNNDIQRTNYGTIIKPLPDKRVAFLLFNNTVLGDTTNSDGLVIDTSNPSSQVTIVKLANSYFGRNGDWAGTYSWTGARNMLIQNTGGGTVSGVHITGTTFNAAGGENLRVIGDNNVNDVTLDNSTLCFGGQAGTNKSNIALQSVQTFAIRNNTIAAGCNSTEFDNTKTPANIYFETNVVNNAVITGNQFYGPYQLGRGPIADASAPISTSQLLITSNWPYDTAEQTIASAAVIDPDYYPVLTLTGTTGVTNIRHPWSGRTLRIMTPSGVTFTAGGGGTDPICTTKTAAAGQVVTAQFWPSANCWAVQ